MQLTEWQENEFNDFISTKGSGVIEFGAPWCGACKMTEPNIAEVSTKHQDLKFAKIDVGKNPKLASKMGVMSLPNVIIFKNGKVIEQFIGATTASVLEQKLVKMK